MKRNRIYLSVDLDFWDGRRFPKRFFDGLLRLGVPIKVVYCHDDLLEHLPSFDVMLNLDFHADLVENYLNKDWSLKKLAERNDGTWLNLVAQPKKKKLIWIYPEEICISGTCNIDSGGFCNQHESLNPFGDKSTQICGWGSTSYRRKMPTVEEKSRVVAIGIAYSKYMIDGPKNRKHLCRPFLEWILWNRRWLSLNRAMMREL